MQKPSLETFFLFLLLGSFVIKEVLLALLLPVYQNPDEQVHYATIQHRAEPKEKNWPITWSKNTAALKAPIDQFHYSEEIIQSGKLLQFDELKHESHNTQNFSHSLTGLAENEIEYNDWKQYIDHYPINVSGTTSLYYWLGAKIENVFTESSFLIRFFHARFVSVFFGTLTVLISFFIAKRMFPTSVLARLSLPLLVAFQPMFSVAAAQVNIDIALIFAFSLFTYSALRLLQDGPKLTSFTLLLSATLLGVFSKGPGIVLCVLMLPLLALLVRKKLPQYTSWQLWGGAMLTVLIMLPIIFTILPQTFITSITHAGTQSVFPNLLHSFSAYFDKTFGIGEWHETLASYWGNFGWLDTQISDTVITTIFILEITAWIGILFFFKRTTLSYLPEKSIIFFLIIMAIALQCAIRFYDWRVFDATGKILIGTPGRYFLPTLIPHLILIITGLGSFTKNLAQFSLLLKVLSLAAMLLASYAIIDVIVPRYYL